MGELGAGGCVERSGAGVSCALRGVRCGIWAVGWWSWGVELKVVMNKELDTHERVRDGLAMEARADRVIDLRTMGERDMVR